VYLEEGLSIATEMQIRKRHQDCHVILCLHCIVLYVSFACIFILIHFIILNNSLNHLLYNSCGFLVYEINLLILNVTRHFQFLVLAFI
jgi:hypothetical protein